MINLGSGLLFLLKGDDLAAACQRALKKLCAIFAGLPSDGDESTGARRTREKFVQDFSQVKFQPENCSNYVEKWFKLTTLNNSDYIRNPGLFSGCHPGNLVPNHYDRVAWGSFFKLFLVLLYAEKAILLPYRFKRPQATWLLLAEQKFEIWPENIDLFRFMDIRHQKDDSLDSYEQRVLRRKVQCATKMFLTTEMYAPEDLNVEDLTAWRVFQTTSRQRNQVHIPLGQIVEELLGNYPGRIHNSVLDWTRNAIERPNSIAFDWATDAPKFDPEIYLRDGVPCPEAFVQDFVHKRSLNGFSPPNVDGRAFVEYVNSLNPTLDAGEAFNLWSQCQAHDLRVRKLENPTPSHVAFGRLNVWLFVYLPAWFRLHPDTTLKYPNSPSEFSGHIHYDFDDYRGDFHEPRPLSLVEFFQKMGWAYAQANATTYRRFFEVIEVSQLPGTAGIVNPVWRVPKGKKALAVTKNVFPSEYFLLLVHFCHALESLSEYFAVNEDLLYLSVQDCLKKGRDFDFESIGFVPCFFLKGRMYFIKTIPPDFFAFVNVKGRLLYYPGLIRFVLILLEAGPRGQNAQWLDSREYDLLCDRVATNDYHLTYLWLNTDKISTVPFPVVVIMKVIRILDAQKAWLSNVGVQVGVKYLDFEVDYDGRSETKWKKIAPLFMYNFTNHQPFSDNAYSDFWTVLNLSFQKFLSANESKTIPLVALLPVVGEGQGKAFFKWEEWESRSIKTNHVKVVKVKSSTITDHLKVEGDYSPVRLRARVTPHGARATFITEMSSVLQPEIVVLMTGQSVVQARGYDKGNHLRHAINGVLNGHDVKLKLGQEFKVFKNMGQLGSDLELLFGLTDFEVVAVEQGWVNLRHPTIPNGLGIIATSRSTQNCICDTHICPLAFKCSREVIDSVGYRNCHSCPLAIYSVNNIAAVALKRAASYDLFLQYEREVAKRRDDMSPQQRTAASSKLHEMAKEAVAWLVVEQSLWLVVKMGSSEGGREQNLITRNPHEVEKTLRQIDFEPKSIEGFLYRLGMSEVFPDLTSPATAFEIDRAARLLLAKQSGLLSAITAPVGFSNAETVVAMIRNLSANGELDIREFTDLLMLTEESWLTRLQSSGSVQSQNFLLSCPVDR